MTSLPIDYKRRPWKSKYITEETPVLSEWFVFGENRETDECDISDGNEDIFTGVPRDVADEIIAIRNKSCQEILAVINRDTRFDEDYDFSTGEPLSPSHPRRRREHPVEKWERDVHVILKDYEWHTFSDLLKLSNLTHAQLSDTLYWLRIRHSNLKFRRARDPEGYHRGEISHRLEKIIPVHLRKT